MNLSWLWCHLYNCDEKRLAVLYSYVADTIIKKNYKDTICRSYLWLSESANTCTDVGNQNFLSTEASGNQDQRSTITYIMAHQTNKWIHSHYIHKLLWRVMIQVILDYWSWSRSRQEMYPKEIYMYWANLLQNCIHSCCWGPTEFSRHPKSLNNSRFSSYTTIITPFIIQLHFAEYKYHAVFVLQRTG